MERNQINIQAYNEFASNPDWMSLHQNKFVLFVRGELIGIFEDKEAINREVQALYANLKIPFMFVRVGKDPAFETRSSR